MNDSEVTALARGMVPFVREVVTEAVAAFAARIAELEARPVEKGDPGERGAEGPQGEIGPPGPEGAAGPKGDDGALGFMPSAFAEQIKSAMQLLDEAPPVIQRNSNAQVTFDRSGEADLRRVTGSMITRDGELAIFYSDGTSERLGSVIGPQGPAGRDGGDGGIGAKGDEGPPGRDGVSITAAAINRRGELMLTLSDGMVLTPGRIVDEKKRT